MTAKVVCGVVVVVCMWEAVGVARVCVCEHGCLRGNKNT